MEKQKNSGIDIDESNHKPAPGFLERLKHTCYAVVMGIIFAQGILFTIGLGSIVRWTHNIILHVYLIGCAILGWVVGEKFIESLGLKSSNWWISPRDLR